MAKTITSFTSHETAEGTRLSATYSVINEDTGAITTSNERFNVVLLKTNPLQENINTITNYLSGKIPG